jgi:L-aminopeptidase/D-esterase-like protein
MKVGVGTSSRRVRHEVADGVALMAFSLGSSVVLAVLLALLLGSL